MSTTYRNSSVSTLKNVAEVLLGGGHVVSPIVIPENPWVDGNPYFTTSATNRDILIALKEVR